MRDESPVRVVPSTSPSEGEGVVKNVPGNAYDKHGSRNPVVVGLMNRFHDGLTGAMASFEPGSVLDVGCGEGRTTAVLAEAFPERIVGLDLEESVVTEAARNVTGGRFLTASVYELPFESGSFDLVCATEMLEHLDDPKSALTELIRVARLAVVVTVPNEPWWRIANMARGRYLSALGNTPGHVQHWSDSSFTSELRSVAETVAVSRVGLWLLGVLSV